MSDFIERKDIVKWLGSIQSDCGRYQDMWHYGEALEQIIKLLDTDVAPVRYGLWYADEDSRIVCSECKHGAPYMYKISDKLVMQELTDYCPNCGARMDGGDDEID